METIKKKINDIRKNNKDKWYFLRLEEEGRTIEVKGFNTWLQILRVNGVNKPSGMDISVKQFNEHLDSALA